MWVRAMEVYGRIAKDVAPKRAKLQQAMKTLEKQKQLAKAQAKVKEISDKVLALREKYDESSAYKEALKNESDNLERKLDRAQVQPRRWPRRRARPLGGLDRRPRGGDDEPGRRLPARGRLPLVLRPLRLRVPLQAAQRHVAQGRAHAQHPVRPEFDFCLFLANPEDVRDWNIQGLPADAFSTENGVLVTRGTRWPLMIDPQEQANKWVKNMEKENGLKLITLKQSDYLRTLENAIQFGQPVLLQEVEEELDPSLEPIMSRAVVKVGNRSIIKLGDKEVDYNPEFRFYLTTKLANPHYTPEISTKATISVNFCVKQQGLEDQLLGTVVRKERPELEAQKNDLVVAVAAGKRKLVELEDTILVLSKAEGSLLDNEELVLTLQSSKTTSIEVTQQLAISEQTEKKIDAAREGYRPSRTARPSSTSCSPTSRASTRCTSSASTRTSASSTSRSRSRRAPTTCRSGSSRSTSTTPTLSTARRAARSSRRTSCSSPSRSAPRSCRAPRR